MIAFYWATSSWSFWFEEVYIPRRIVKLLSSETILIAQYCFWAFLLFGIMVFKNPDKNIRCTIDRIARNVCLSVTVKYLSPLHTKKTINRIGDIRFTLRDVGKATIRYAPWPASGHACLLYLINTYN